MTVSSEVGSSMFFQAAVICLQAHMVSQQPRTKTLTVNFVIFAMSRMVKDLLT